MSKSKRLIAMLLVTAMLVSLLTVVPAAADQLVFANDYVDPDGILQNTAFLVDSSAANYAQGEPLLSVWDGVSYVFTVGENVFPNYDAAVAAAEMLFKGDRLQIIIASGNYQNIEINESMDVFGVNWRNNPNTVNPNDPTQNWTESSVWKTQCTNVNNVFVNAGASRVINVWGVRVQGRICDSSRPISSTKTTFRLRNVILDQVSTAIGKPQIPGPGWFDSYAMSLENYNTLNEAESAKNNADEVFFENFRISNLATPCTRLMDEFVPPHVTFDGCYFNSNTPGLTDVAFWMKWKPNMRNCNVTVKNSFITGTAKNKMYFEAYQTKASDPANGRAASIDIVDNVFSNSVTTGGVIAIYGKAFDQMHLDNNLVVNKSSTTFSNFVTMFQNWYTDELDTTDFTGHMTMRDNTIIGLNGFSFDYGTENSLVDVTGSYVAPYSEQWRAETSTQLPTGKVTYEYCYYDAARTHKTNDIPAFTVNGVSLDAAAPTVFQAPGGDTFTFSVSGLKYYSVFESDENYSNAALLNEMTPVSQISLKEVNNYYLFVAYSDDMNNSAVYPVCVSKPDKQIGTLPLSDFTPADSVVEAAGLHVNVRINRDASECSFRFNEGDTVLTDAICETGHNLSRSGDVITVSQLQMNDTAVVRLTVTKGAATENYYVNVTRALSSACELISCGNAVFADGKLTATVSDSELTVAPVVSENATVSVWIGSTAFPANADGSFTITGITESATYQVGVVAENGVDYHIYPLEITTAKSGAAQLIAVKNATADSYGYSASASGAFVVDAVVSDGATYQVFSDAACKNVIADNTVNVTDNMTVYIVVTSENGAHQSVPVALRLSQPGANISLTGFKDVNKDAYYAEAVVWAVTNDVTSGTSSATFSPNDKCTRAQVVTFLWRACGSPASTTAKTSFKDIKSTAFYYDAVLWAVENGITSGTTVTTFEPNATCTRAQVVTFLHRAKNKPAPSGTNTAFEDVDKNGFYYDAMLWAVENGITNGTAATTFSPDADCSRGQVVTFLYRAQ